GLFGERSVVAVSSNGRYVAAGVESNRNEMQIINIDKWACLGADGEKRDGTLLNHKLWVYDAAFSPNEKILATAWGMPQAPVRSRQGTRPAGDGGEVRIWSLDGGRPAADPIKFEYQVRCVAFSPDGALLVVASSNPFSLVEQPGPLKE